MLDWILDQYVSSFENLAEISKPISDFLDGADSFPTLMPTVGMALLTVLVPFAIAILSHFLSSESEKKEDAFLTLDLYVILDRIFVIKNLLTSNFLIFLPPLFWDIFPDGRLWILLVWISGVVWLTHMIYHVYGWRTTHDTDLRFRYLESLRDENRMKVVWPSVWISARLDDRNERRFLSIFADHIDMLFEEKKYSDVIFLVDSFRESLPHRMDLSLFAGEESFYGRLLEWRYQLFMKTEEQNKSENGGVVEDDFVFEHTVSMVDALIVQIMRDLITHRHLFWFYSEIGKHTEKYEGDQGYLRDLYHQFLEDYFDGVVAQQGRLSAWEGFPDYWQITSNKEKDIQEFVSSIILDEFILWLRSKINAENIASGKGIEKLAEHIYPNIDIDVLLRLYILIYKKSHGNRLESIVEKKWDFGFNEIQISGEEEERTYDLILSQENITQFISKEMIIRWESEVKALLRKRWNYTQKHQFDLMRGLITTLSKKYHDLFL